MLLHWPKSTAWLYHGCRNQNENMFEDETSKVVQRIVAMSREGPKQYVQDLLQRDQAFVHDVISNRKGNIYICGKVKFDSREALMIFRVSVSRFNCIVPLGSIG